ncbi:hypothetical protein [Motiliproteus sp.]|uniref:hypothetical protein n=1 Tax=Motiliproteus sp. TaxID=1898955 RepID=UPI003BAC77AD
MKFRIDLDITPEELRRVLGWPDVQELQQEMLAKVRENIESEGFDPTSMMKLYTGGSIEPMQRLLMQLMSGYNPFDGKTDNSTENKKDKG